MQSIGRLERIHENHPMGENKSAGVVVRRPAAASAERDAAPAKSGAGEEVELVSTQMLKQILSSKDFENRQGVADAAKKDAEGVLARDPETGYFVILDEDELKAIVESGQDLPKLSRPSDVTAAPLHDYADDEHLSLVSVRALRRVLDENTRCDQEVEATEADDEEFNPYCS
jgi:hypothetical protein